MNKIVKIIGANITYSGFTYNTRLMIEFEHTGEYYYYLTPKCKHTLSGIESAREYRNKKKKIYKSSGYYHINRLAIPSASNDNRLNWWYINNPGDYYTVNKVSKYAKKIYAELRKENITVFNN